MNIKAVERETGISSRNISRTRWLYRRWIRPERNKVSDYREYDDGMVRRLKLIKILLR